MSTATVSFEPKPSLPPPVATSGVLGWLRTNLFSTWLNTAFTLLAVYVMWLVLPPVVEWMITEAIWIGDKTEECKNPDETRKGGACWIYIRAWVGGFMYGLYPYDLRWRVDLAGILAVALMVPVFIKAMPYRAIYGLVAILLVPAVASLLFYGWYDFPPNVPEAQTHPWRVVETAKWGGLSLTLLIAWVGIGASLPIGVVLALGRRSKMPIVSALCVGFIELWRGVPLITVLFMSSVMLPLFLPEGVSFDKLLRALIGVTLFSAAYLAEVVRGGLQAIPRGQFEAASALGLSYPKSMALIVLPQALKIVIPGIVNSFIGLFKDTTLVAVIGMYDFLGAVALGNADPKWLGYAVEGYVFAALFYFVFCFSMSRYSLALERKLHTGHKR
jgi:general L-amino acid transport system permease protein